MTLLITAISVLLFTLSGLLICRAIGKGIKAYLKIKEAKTKPFWKVYSGAATGKEKGVLVGVYQHYPDCINKINDSFMATAWIKNGDEDYLSKYSDAMSKASQKADLMNGVERVVVRDHFLA